MSSRAAATMDADGDVEMTVPAPVYELIAAPKLSSWSHDELVKWSRERIQYEEKIRQRCSVTGEDYASVVSAGNERLERSFPKER
ncbi:hypothetical protein PR003_g31171 [Phytophthora rubi]|nr:hypothetical protein PR002_g28156 [Phytophthora rubi]KAE9269350.1 hypothetical protein PR003_g31171 [Phytophthora rubi]